MESEGLRESPAVAPIQRVMNTMEKFIKTQENWYPAFPPLEYGNPYEECGVYVGCHPPTVDDKNWGVGVWGLDDFGMELFGLSQIEAKDIYDKITDYTTQAGLKRLGLRSA